MDRFTYQSGGPQEPLKLRAPYFNAINPTTVTFPQEQVSAYVDSLGHIEFFDAQGNSLGCVDRPATESPDMYAHSGQYGEVLCKADGQRVMLQLSVYRWEDDYPYCDGDSDRWMRRVAGWFQVTYECRTGEIRVEEL